MSLGMGRLHRVCMFDVGGALNPIDPLDTVCCDLTERSCRTRITLLQQIRRQRQGCFYWEGLGSCIYAIL